MQRSEANALVNARENKAAQCQELHLRILGMHCEGCAERVMSALRTIDGVAEARVSLLPPEAAVKTARALSIEEINQVLEKVGRYRATEHRQSESDAQMFQIALPTLESPAPPRASALKFWQDNPTWRRASLNTLNCLVGCSIGDFGFIIYAQATGLAWSMWLIMGVAMLCGLSTSVMMETLLLKWREKFGWRAALQTALSMSFLSMLAMELAENITDYLLTGGAATPHEPFFWVALALSMLAGFLVPLPYNYFKLRKYNKACH